MIAAAQRVPEAAPSWTPAERLEELQGISAEDAEYLRHACKTDLYLFAKGILGYPHINPFTHREFCAEIVGAATKRRLFLMPRAHLKSTIATIADSMRLVICNPDNTAVLIASETATQAQKFLKEIKNHWQHNEVLRTLFPELVPERFTGPGTDWAQTRASINSETVSRQSHWETIGVGGAPTGNHYTRIKCDDLIGLDAYRSPAMMKTAKDWNDTIEPLLTNQHVDIIDWIGTRWSRHDLAAHVMKFYGNSLSVYTRQAIENGQIIFPELHTWEEYTRLQTENPTLWYAQYENNPVEGGAKDLPYGSIQPYYLSPDHQDVVINLPDGAEKRWKVSDLDRVTICDPNSGSPVAPDMAAIVTLGLSPDDEYFVLDSWSGRVDPFQLCHELLRICRHWKPRVAGIEKAGQQNTEFYFKKLCKDESCFVNTVPVTPAGRDKEERIRYAMQPIVAGGRFYMLPSQTVLRSQITEFPDLILWDEIDAAAYAAETLLKPRGQRKRGERHKLLHLVMNTRNPRTGY